MNEEALRRRLERARRKVELLETMIEDKTREIFFKNEALRRTNASLVELQRLMPGALVVTDAEGTIETVNAATLELLQKINEEQRVAIVMATHSRDAAGRAGRIVHLADGALVEAP